jgi:eukaryotic-like serine/threonine-protein kinase
MFEITAEIKYQQIEPIGKGEGMNSIVFRACDPYLQREIAVKEIKKSKLGNDFDSYCEEARAMFAVADTNIVGLEYICETPDYIALALPYFSAGSLGARIKQNPLSLRELLKMAHGVLAGVQRIHAKGFLHLDLKPSNILFDEIGRPLIADFGQSRRISPQGTVISPDIYKWAMPSEVFKSHVATIESDIYQLGVLLYRSANGDPLYRSQKSAITTDAELVTKVSRGKFPDAKLFLPHVPPRIKAIIRKAMRTEPSERYRSASELAAALGRARLPFDWVTKNLGNGAYNWHATRQGRADLDVELSQNGNSEWQTEVWSTKGTERRKKNKADYWRSNLSYEEAAKHLTAVFADLNQ